VESEISKWREPLPEPERPVRPSQPPKPAGFSNAQRDALGMRPGKPRPSLQSLRGGGAVDFKGRPVQRKDATLTSAPDRDELKALIAKALSKK